MSSHSILAQRPFQLPQSRGLHLPLSGGPGSLHIPSLLSKKTAAKTKTAENLMFSDRALCALLIPVIVEQFLNALMGMADTMMISNLGSTAISAVSLTDSSIP